MGFPACSQKRGALGKERVTGSSAKRPLVKVRGSSGDDKKEKGEGSKKAVIKVAV